MTRPFMRGLGRPAVRRLTAAGSACAVLALAAGGCGGGDSASSVYTVRAIFDSAGFVIPGLDVKIAGVKVGKVTAVDLTDDNHAAVTFTILNKGFQDLRKDAFCTIRPQALIGERYVECELTQARPDGATAPAALPKIARGPYQDEHLLPVEQTAVPVDADQVLSTSDASSRDRFGIIIRELGAGLSGRGDELGSTLRKTNEGLRVTNDFLKKLSDQKAMLVELAETSDRTLASLAAERSSITGAVENGATVSTRLASRRTELKASIASLNTLLAEVPASADRVTELTSELAPIAKDLNRSADDAATIINSLPELSDRATTAFTALSPTLNKGREVLTTNDAFFDRLVKTSGAVKASVSVLGLTLGDFRSAGGLDYFMDAIYGLAYATNGRDASGSYLRAAAINYLTCALKVNLVNTGNGTCANTLSAEAGRTAAASANGARVTATDAVKSTTPDAAGATTPVAGQRSGAAATTPKSTTPTATSPSGTTPQTDLDRTAAQLLLGGGR